MRYIASCADFLVFKSDNIMLNNYIWKLYKQNEGTQITNMFRENLMGKPTKSFADEIKQLHLRYAIENVAEENKNQLLELPIAVKAKTITPGAIRSTAQEKVIFQIIDATMQNAIKHWLKEYGKEQDVFLYFINRLSFISTKWAISYPGIFIPYYFSKNYNVLSSIADTFEISLPVIPKKSDYLGRVWHYGELCKSFYKFRKENDLPFYDFCAFLYDFAPQYIGGKDSYIIYNLPKPKSAFFVGGGGDNMDATAEDDPDSICFWQCNANTRAGDLVVMYLRTPISAISSIWRSKSVGFVDPFFYYYNCTYIGSPAKGKQIPLKAIKSDQCLGNMPIVKKNMQGINGIELLPSEYNHIADLTGATVSKLEYVVDSRNSVYENEKAVEEKLIKPLLARLGYAENEYVQQMYVEIGNHNHALIPDFVIHPNGASGHYSGDIVIEAKRSVSSEKQLVEVKTQVRSYAKLLGAKFAVIASQEKIWVMSAKDDYSECVYETGWDTLVDADAFYRLKQLIGNW